MSPENLITANALLTKAELAQLNDVLVEEQLRKLIDANMPAPLRQAMQAEAQVRGLVTSAQATYRDIEKVAILTGAAPWGEGSRKTPMGRWSYHPDGYFVGYYPEGYSKTKLDVYVPECLKIVRDNKGRITMIDDLKGSRIETTYMEQAQEVPSDGGVEGYAFNSVRVTAGGRSTSLNGSGWTLIGTPTGKGNPAAGGVFTDMPQRYAWGAQWADANANILGGGGAGIGSLTSMFKSGKGRDTLMDLAHYEYALNKAGALKGSDLVRRAWFYELCLRRGGCKEPCAETTKIFDPAESVATPGNTSRQRLGISARAFK